MQDTPVTTNLNAGDFQALDELLYVKNNLRKVHGTKIFEKLTYLLTNNPLIKVINSSNSEKDSEATSVYYHIKLPLDSVRAYYESQRISVRINSEKENEKIKRRYITDTIIDPFTSWLYELVAQDKNLNEMLDDLRSRYDFPIQNFVIPNLFSLTIGIQNDVVYISYKLI